MVVPSVSAERTLTSLYEAIHRRRDVRGQFTGAPIDPEALERMLAAAHAAPSVGLTQPWDFVLVSDVALKQAFVEHINIERGVFAESLPPERASVFANIKIDGVMESTLSVVVTYDAARGAPAVLGRHAIADAGLYSVCLAIQNLWLAARSEGLGMGWVSLFDPVALAQMLSMPAGAVPVGVLCIGLVEAFYPAPMLELTGWAQARPLDELVFDNHWNSRQPV